MSGWAEKRSRKKWVWSPPGDHTLGDVRLNAKPRNRIHVAWIILISECHVNHKANGKTCLNRFPASLSCHDCCTHTCYDTLQWFTSLRSISDLLTPCTVWKKKRRKWEQVGESTVHKHLGCGNLRWTCATFNTPRAAYCWQLAGWMSQHAQQRAY